MQVETENKEDEPDHSESAQIRGEGENISNVENKELSVKDAQDDLAHNEHEVVGVAEDNKEETREKMQVEDENENQNADMQQHEENA